MLRHLRILLTMAILVLTGVVNAPVYSDDPLQKIETNDPLVQAAGNWTHQNAGGASGGSYAYSGGSPDDVLTLAFDGSSLSILYVAGPSLGILAVEIDGTVLRTIITAADTVQYSQYAHFNYLAGGSHTLRLYASSGVIALDAIVATPTPTIPATPGTPEATSPGERGYDTLAALGELDPLAGPTMTLYHSFADTAASGDYWRQAVNYLVNVMGDWDGDGHATFGTVYAGRFDYTNVTPDAFTNAENESARVELGAEGYPVVGRFNLAFANDCIGVVAPFAENPGLFALTYVCDFAASTPVVRQQYLGSPLPDHEGYSGPYSFAAGDFDGDGLDSVAVLRGAMITYTNLDPSEGDAVFNEYQYWGEPFHEGGPAALLVGDWDGDSVDSFGVVYGPSSTAVSYFYRRNDLGSGEASLTLQVVTGTNRVAVWR